MNYYVKRLFLSLTKWIPDKAYLRMVYLIVLKEKLHLDHPKSFTEKMQWLKIYDCKPEYGKYADKILVREHVKEVLGEKYLIKQYGVYDSANDIPFDTLPNRFVLKCNHDSGSTLICFDKSKFDKQEAVRYLNKRLKLPFYLEGRENVYKYVTPKVVCEELLGNSQSVPSDYKIFCFSGEPRFLVVDVDRFGNHLQYFYNTKWERLDMSAGYTPAKGDNLDKPKEFETLLNAARKLSRNMKFVRTDFYIVDGRVYFGELTFYPGAGFQHFSPKEMDQELAELIVCE